MDLLFSRAVLISIGRAGCENISCPDFLDFGNMCLFHFILTRMHETTHLSCILLIETGQ